MDRRQLHLVRHLQVRQHVVDNLLQDDVPGDATAQEVVEPGMGILGIASNENGLLWTLI